MPAARLITVSTGDDRHAGELFSAAPLDVTAGSIGAAVQQEANSGRLTLVRDTG